VFSRGWRSLSQLRKMGVQYLVLPDAVFQRYMKADPPPPGTAAHYRYSTNIRYYESLLSPQSGGAVKVAEFSAGVSLPARGGAISVYRILPDPSGAAGTGSAGYGFEWLPGATATG